MNRTGYAKDKPEQNHSGKNLVPGGVEGFYARTCLGPIPAPRAPAPAWQTSPSSCRPLCTLCQGVAIFPRMGGFNLIQERTCLDIRSMLSPSRCSLRPRAPAVEQASMPTYMFLPTADEFVAAGCHCDRGYCGAWRCCQGLGGARLTARENRAVS